MCMKYDSFNQKSTKKNHNALVTDVKVTRKYNDTMK